MTGSVLQAVAATHAWFEGNSGWAPPDPGTLAEWMADGVCRCPDGCRVAPAAVCPHGLASWWLVMRSLDSPGASPPLPPERVVPLPARLSPLRPDYVAVLDAHHRALEAGQPGYFDPTSGLFVMTARALWDRGSCCAQGCRHCPYAGRSGSSSAMAPAEATEHRRPPSC